MPVIKIVSSKYLIIAISLNKYVKSHNKYAIF
jgi:hypothetical protein